MQEIRDKEGRYIIVKGKLEKEMVTLINVYAPILDHRIDTTSIKRNKTHITKLMNMSLKVQGLVDVYTTSNGKRIHALLYHT